MRGFSTFTTNLGLPDVFERVEANGSSGLVKSQTRPATQTSNTNAKMISENFKGVFMPRMVAADDGGGQTNCRLPTGDWRLGDWRLAISDCRLAIAD